MDVEVVLLKSELCRDDVFLVLNNRSLLCLKQS